MAARPWLRTAVRAGAPLLLVLLLGGCMLPPEPRTTAARDVWNLYAVVFAMGLAVFIAVEGFIVYAVFRYRRRDDRLPHQLHGNRTVEILWTAIPTVIVLVLFVLSVITLSTVNAESPRPAVRIEVTGIQWQWSFHYFDDDDDPKNDLVVSGSPANPPVMGLPVGEPVHLVLGTEDVIHSFYVPNFLIKRDVIPVGNPEDRNTLEFTVTDAGTYAGQCAEFCGDLHDQMTFSVEAMSRADFDRWLARGKAGKAAETPRPSVKPGGEVVELVADHIAFDKKELHAPAGEPFTLRLTNKEAVVHNVVFVDANDKIVFRAGDVKGPDASEEFAVDALEPGEYTFYCEYHPVPDMTGTLIVE